FLERWRNGIAEFESLDLSKPKYAAQAGDVLVAAANFFLAYLGWPLVEEQARNARVLRTMARTAYPQYADVPIRRIGARRRRMGVFSSSLNAHSVSRVWSSALLSLDRQEFELGAFYAGTVEDVSTERWRSMTSRFESGSRPVAEWFGALRAYAPDVVIF